MIAAMLDPFVLNENHLTLGVSIGIAAHKDGEMDPEELLQQADQAMYRAKLAGGTRTGNSESSAIRLVARQDTKNDHGAFGIEMKADAQIPARSRNSSPRGPRSRLTSPSAVSMKRRTTRVTRC
jgi:GGDEF domain-containing protein